MLKLNSVEIINFKSFQGTHWFEFPETSGVYFLTGHNKVDDLESNGAGKSTFLDAIVWCLYGRTSRGLKAGDVLPWGSSGPVSVTLDLTVGYRFTVKRTQKPNGLWIDNKPIDQEELQKHIRLNFDSFLHSVMNAQFGDSFFSLSPTDKLSLFSNIMELDFWLEKSALASQETKLIETNIAKMEKLMTQATERKDLITLNLEELEAFSDAFKDDKMKEVKSIEAAIKLLKMNTGATDNEISHLKIKKYKIEDDVQLVNWEIGRVSKSIDYQVARVQKHAVDFRLAEETLKGNKERLIDFQKAGGVCLCCGRQIPPEHAKSHSKGIEMNIEKAEGDSILAKELKQVAMDDLIVVKTHLEAEEAKLARLNKQISKVEAEITEAVLLAKASEQRVTELESTLLKKRNESNPYLKSIEQKRVALQSADDDLRISKKKLMELDAAYEATSFWIKGFKRVRLFIIEQTFRTLELEVNNSLAQLGLPDWQITFDVERENKSGGMTKGFMVFVKSPKNKDPVKWESWSGGETQRLALAGDLGLANLICQQAGLTNTIEFYDEPSTHMSQKGVTDLAHMLHERALAEGKTIWIVDHVALTNFGDLQDTITVEKTKNGSAIKRN